MVDVSASSKPEHICGHCWKGVVANQVGLLSPPLSQPDVLGPCEGGYVYKISGKAIKANADAGCRWCKLLVGCTSRSDSQSKQVEIRLGRDKDNEDTLTIYVDDNIFWFGYVYTKADDPAAASIRGRSLFCDVGSERALSDAMDLMRDCVDNHDCPAPNLSPILPTRVIDCSDLSQPHLMETNGKRDRYVALSYVWGGEQTKRTTTENIDGYMTSIDLENQPKTIQDAIEITHRLGVAYLWIDSLCIIQDSDDDKVNELTRMHEYYSNTYLTIIAASAAGVADGFLQTRTDTLGAAAVTLPFVLPDAIGSVSLSSWLITTPKYEPTSEPLHTRGWCMQEFFLSPRELIFASHTLQYRCQKCTRNIAGADNGWWISSEHEPSPNRRLPKSPQTREESETVRKAWTAMVENYTKRALSFSDDKLVALSALTEEFYMIIQTPYLAGLWRSTLLLDLLWKKDWPDGHYARPKANYRAPSWSWASLEGPINAGNAYFLSGETEKEVSLEAEVVHCETVPENARLPFGAITSGVLVLSAPIVMECVVMPHWAVYRLLGREGRPGGDYPTGLIHEDHNDEDPASRLEEIGLAQLDSSDDDVTSGGLHVSVVVIYRRNDINPGTRVVQGLVLERLSPDISTTEGGRGTYRRVGFFQRTGDAKEVDDWMDSIPRAEMQIV